MSKIYWVMHKNGEYSGCWNKDAECPSFDAAVIERDKSIESYQTETIIVELVPIKILDGRKTEDSQ